ncbi:MAG: pyridoxal phosphate-dependent aminotransferase [Deltaproteobacteria bacterium]|nr:pyridoxal phosphate-dependent aminotransferase [Deltaproteobacteria bacterium]
MGPTPASNPPKKPRRPTVAKISSRLLEIKPSVTLAVTQKAGELRAKGIDVISLSAGEPDFATPAHIVAAAKQALDDGMTRYTPVAGIPALRQAVAKESAEARGVACDPSRVVVTVGAKHALFNFFQAVLDPGDVVVVPAPYWVSYPDQVLLAGGQPVFVQTRAEDGFALRPEDLEKVIGPKTKAVVINTPSNPTGGVYTREQTEAITRFALDRGLWVLSDEIYRDLVYEGAEHVSPLTAAGGEGAERVFVVDGVSKTYAMTGWRIGWGIGDPELIGAMSKIQGQSTSNPTSLAQAGALAAVEQPSDFLEEWCAQYRRRRDVIVQGLEAIPGVTCTVPQGAFYVLPDVSHYVERLGRGASDIELATLLLEKANVATVPGSAFGAPGFIRLSYATSLEMIEKGLERLAAAFAAL